MNVKKLFTIFVAVLSLLSGCDNNANTNDSDNGMVLDSAQTQTSEQVNNEAIKLKLAVYGGHISRLSKNLMKTNRSIISRWRITRRRAL